MTFYLSQKKCIFSVFLSTASLLFCFCGSSTQTESLTSSDFASDTLVIREILDSNDHTMISVLSVVGQNRSRVDSLFLAAKNISNRLDLFYKLTALKYLDCRRNSITNFYFNGCVSMETLLLDSNSISCLQYSLKDLRSIRTFSVSFNRLVDITPNIIKCSTLTTLNISHNELKSLPDSIFRLKTLQSLDLGYNKIKSDTLSAAVKSWADALDPDWILTQGH